MHSSTEIEQLAANFETNVHINLNSDQTEQLNNIAHCFSEQLMPNSSEVPLHTNPPTTWIFFSMHKADAKWLKAEQNIICNMKENFESVCQKPEKNSRTRAAWPSNEKRPLERTLHLL